MNHFVFVCLLFSVQCFGQSLTEEDKFMSKLVKSEIVPDGLLSTRSALIFSDSYSQEELSKIQKAFQQTGIDALEYFQSSVVISGKDVQNAFITILNKRSVKFLIFARKDGQEYQLWFLPFNPRYLWVSPSQTAWMVHGSNLQDLLVGIFRTLSSTQKKQNFLINDIPELESVPNLFANVRNEAMIPNLKAFKVGVPAMGNPEDDAILAAYLQENYHGKYEIIPDTLREKDMIQKGIRYVVRYVHASGQIAKSLLGYDMSKSESALLSATYPNGKLALKTIPSQTSIYKFYFKDLDDRNLYFGLKWDADIYWLDALKNYIDGYRVTGRIN